MKHICGDLWGEDPNWSVLECPLPINQLASQVFFFFGYILVKINLTKFLYFIFFLQDELASWLYRIFLYVVLPPTRPAYETFRVDHPLNLLAFVTVPLLLPYSFSLTFIFQLLNRLAVVGYPHHWLATVLDNLLSGKIKVHFLIQSIGYLLTNTFKTIARPPPNSLNTQYPL
jgi:hypothetical protein